MTRLNAIWLSNITDAGRMRLHATLWPNFGYCQRLHLERDGVVVEGFIQQ
jgi:hypothetical protein